MSDAVADEIDRIIRDARKHHMKAIQQTEKKLIALYQKAADDVGKLILSYGPEAENVAMYYELRQQLEDRIRKLAEEASRIVSDTIGSEAARGIRSTAASVLEASHGIVGMLPSAEFGRIYTEAVRAMSVTIDGLELSAKIWRINQVTLQGMRELLLEGMLSGRSSSEIYRQMKMYLKLNKVNLSTKFWRDYFEKHPPGRGVYRSAWKNVLRVMRTETNRAFREGAQLYAQGKTWAKGMKFNLSSAHPEPDICDDLADQDSGLGPGVYPVGSAPTSPHPHCFCYLTVELTDEIAATIPA